MSELKCGFQSGDRDLVENMDETHAIVNVVTSRMLEFCGDENVKYADVVSGGENDMFLMVRKTDVVFSRTCSSMMIFQNHYHTYPMRGVPDNVVGVNYRSDPKRWSDKKIVVQCS